MKVNKVAIMLIALSILVVIALPNVMSAVTTNITLSSSGSIVAQQGSGSQMSFGYTTVGSQTFGTYSQDVYSSNYSLSQALWIENITAYFTALSGTVNAQAVIYYNNGTLAAIGSELTGIGTTAAWYTFTVNPVVQIPAGNYMLGIQATGQTNFYCDYNFSATTLGVYSFTNTFRSFPVTTTFGGPTGSGVEELSIYATGSTSAVSYPPSIILNNPINCTAYAHDPIVFTYTPQFANSAQLWMNISGTWQSVASNSTKIINGALNNISYSMPQDNNQYVWNIEGINSVGTAFASGNYTLRDSPLGSGMALAADGSNLLNSAGQVVNIRGMGLLIIAPNLLFWTSSGSDNWGDEWQAANTSAVTQTLQELSTVWHVNMIRFFIYPEWWWLDNVSPYNESGYWSPGQTESTRTYIETLVSECETYGIYADICPYQLTANSGSFNSDPYLDSGGGSNIPMSGEWDATQIAFFNAQGYGSGGTITSAQEASFWTAYWTSMANALKPYPNVIFEAWNEPLVGTSYNIIPSGYLSYLSTMYHAIRATGSTSLIFMQWCSGWAPNVGFNLNWAAQISNALIPTNVAYTFHLYYYAPSDETTFWNQGGVDTSAGGVPYTTAQLETLLQTQALNTMGITAPLISNEEGDCTADTSNITADQVWWNNLLQAQNALGVGEDAYFWLSSSGLGPTLAAGEALLASGYTPNTFGQDYLNAAS